MTPTLLLESAVTWCLALENRTALIFWLGCILAEIALMAVFPSQAILILVVSMIGWFGALFYLALFRPR
jgi:hypothetical protein